MGAMVFLSCYPVERSEMFDGWVEFLRGRRGQSCVEQWTNVEILFSFKCTKARMSCCTWVVLVSSHGVQSPSCHCVSSRGLHQSLCPPFRVENQYFSSTETLYPSEFLCGRQCRTISTYTYLWWNWYHEKVLSCAYATRHAKARHFHERLGQRDIGIKVESRSRKSGVAWNPISCAGCKGTRSDRDATGGAL